MWWMATAATLHGAVPDDMQEKLEEVGESLLHCTNIT
jgi:hypothetical protein